MSRSIRALAVGAMLALAPAIVPATPVVRVKDIATLRGMRGNQLLGIGLVTGLAGKGDAAGSALLQSTLASLVASFGVSIAAQDLRSRNCAVVMVSAELPAFARAGDRVDATVASIGDARDLDGGMLLQAALLAANGRTYAVAQGRVVSTADLAAAKTTGIVTQGALVEQGVTGSFIEDDTISIVLRNPDFVTAKAVQQAVASAFPGAAVSAPDPSMVQVRLPAERRSDPVGFVAQLEALTVTPDSASRVVVNAASGIIVMGEHVRIGKVAVAYRGVRVTVGATTRALAGQEEPDPLVIPDTASVDEFVTALKAAGLKADVIIGMLQAVERAGALFGTLVVM